MPEHEALVTGLLRRRRLLQRVLEFLLEVVEPGAQMGVPADLRHLPHLRHGGVPEAPSHDAVHHLVEPRVEAGGDVDDAATEQAEAAAVEPHGVVGALEGGEDPRIIGERIQLALGVPDVPGVLLRWHVSTMERDERLESGLADAPEHEHDAGIGRVQLLCLAEDGDEHRIEERLEESLCFGGGADEKQIADECQGSLPFQERTANPRQGFLPLRKNGRGSVGRKLWKSKV